MRPERAAPPSPGQRPGYVLVIKKRPVRAKALKYQMIYKAFALTGRLVYVHDYPGRCPGLGASALSGRVANRGDLLISILLSCGESGRFVLFQSSYHVANLGDLIYFNPPIMWRIWAVLAFSLGVFLYFKYPSRESSKHSFAFFLSAADEPELSEEPETFSEEEAPELSAAKRWQKPMR